MNIRLIITASFSITCIHIFHCSVVIMINGSILGYLKTEPAHDKTYGKACATSEDSDQPAHPRSLIRVFADRMCLLQPPGDPKKDRRELLLYLVDTQGNPISGYRRLRDFGGKQMVSSSDSVCTYPLLIITKVLLEDKQRNLYFLS